MYYYFFSYAYENGFGHCGDCRNSPITTITDITETAKKIETEHGLSNVVILNYKLMRKGSYTKHHLRKHKI